MFSPKMWEKKAYLKSLSYSECLRGKKSEYFHYMPIGVLRWLYLEQADKYFTARKVAFAYPWLESGLVFIAFIRLLLKVCAIAWWPEPSKSRRNLSVVLNSSRFLNRKNPLLRSISSNSGDKGQTRSTNFLRDVLPSTVFFWNKNK